MWSPARLARLVLAAGVATWLVNAVILLATAYPLGHDETQYAISGRDLLAGAAPRFDWFYISKGMSVVAAPGVLAGGGDVAMRIAPLVFGLGFLLATWQLARRTFDDVTAAWAVAVIAGSRSYVRFSVELLSDLPAATCLVAAAAVIVTELGRGEARWRLVLAAPLLSAAFYLRYGSSVPIALLVVAAAVIGAPTIRRRPAPIIATAVAFAALLVPHAAMAVRDVGSPLGILLASQAVPARTSLLDGLLTYVTANPLAFYGIAATPALIAGVLGLRRDRRVVLLWVAAIADVIAIGLSSHAQVRYVFFGTTLLIVLGVGALRELIGRCGPRPRVALVGLGIATLAFAWISITRSTPHQGDARTANDRRTLDAAAAVRADARGRECYVLADRHGQLEWYSGCRAATFAAADVAARGLPLYAVFDDLRPWSLSLDGLPGRRRVVLDQPGIIRVIAVDPP